MDFAEESTNLPIDLLVVIGLARLRIGRWLQFSMGALGFLMSMSVTALMEPPMSGLMEPLTGADLGSRTG